MKRFPELAEECHNILGIGFQNNTNISSNHDFHLSAYNIRQVMLLIKTQTFFTIKFVGHFFQQIVKTDKIRNNQEYKNIPDIF